MDKPRIIIADTDENYIMSLQLKFAEEFFEKIDLEIITDINYFKELFSSHQKIDLLVISEEFYSISLQKHNILQIHLLVENLSKENFIVHNASQVFKYSSIQEVFNEIISKNEYLLELKNSTNNLTKDNPKVIVVSSAVGGVGKTTVAMGICGTLAKNFKRVLYIDAEQLQSFQYYMQDATPINNNHIYAKLLEEEENEYYMLKHFIRKEIFSYIPPFKAPLDSLGLNDTLFLRIIQQVRQAEEYDYIVVDTDSKFDYLKMKLLEIADLVFFITNQNYYSVQATKLLLSNIDGVNTGKYLLVCNKYVHEKPNYLSELTQNISVDEYIGSISDSKEFMCKNVIEFEDFKKLVYGLIVGRKRINE